MKTPHYRTVEELEVRTNKEKYYTLPSRSFVQVMNLKYLPEGFENSWWIFDPKTEVICYCSFGFVKLPKDKIEKC